MAGILTYSAIVPCLWLFARATNAGVADLATSAKAACAQSPGSEACATVALAKETVLLQAARRSARSMLSQATRNLSCEDCLKIFEDAGGCAAMQASDWEMVQTVSQLPALAGCQDLECGDLLASRCRERPLGPPQSCNASCISAFSAVDGCAALRSSNASKLTELVMSPALLGCNLAPCETEVFEECFPPATEEFCRQCVAQFDSNGGCEAPAELAEAHVPADCRPCGEQAMTHCAGKKMKTGGDEGCDVCVRALGPAASCASMFAGEDSASLPSECLRLGQRCLRQAASHCGRWSAAEGCHTVLEGDACFPNVNWAMQTGIALHPEWYPGLGRWSSFEEFQAFLHQHPSHSCPEPCSTLPEILCRTAVPGEECHLHATWAMEAGVIASPEAYPAELRNGNSTLQHFQAWLHHIHHGNCLEPCRPAEETGRAFASLALARETVLLQAARRSIRSTGAQPTKNISCEDCFKTFEQAGGCTAVHEGDWELLQNVSQLEALAGCRDLDCGDVLQTRCAQQPLEPELCEASCVSAFVAAGGCAALVNSSQSRMAEIVVSADLVACSLALCETEIFEECFPPVKEEFCQQCIAQFDVSGGCEAPAELAGAYVPADCWPCGEQAMTHCAEKGTPVAEECDACLRALGAAETCASMFEGENSTALPVECIRLGQECLQQAAAHCGRWSAESCHTADKGDACFPHIHWAMQTGVVAHPEWYPGLSQWSGFEEFQGVLHQHAAPNCPTPCAPLPETLCHTTAPGEECHHHATWAMEAGVSVLPAAYPATLLHGNSTMEDFQAWLHHIHHGDCPKPCRHAEGP